MKPTVWCGPWRGCSLSPADSIVALVRNVAIPDPASTALGIVPLFEAFEDVFQ